MTVQFPNLTPAYLEKDVAIPVAQFITKKYGKSGFKLQSELNPALNWRPTIQVKTSRFTTMGIEVSEILYPQVLKGISHDLVADFSDSPIIVCVACPLAVYQEDARQAAVSKLRSHGFGILTVDDQGTVIEQVKSIPLIHHISEADLLPRIKGLTSSVKVQVRQAYDTYRINSYQGLQDVAQVIEGLIFGFAKGAKSKGWIAKVQNDAANVLDDLFACTKDPLRSQRAAIGATRGFVKFYRNLSSHPPKTTKAAATLIKECRGGFFQALQVADQLSSAMRNCDLTVRLHIP